MITDEAKQAIEGATPKPTILGMNDHKGSSVIVAAFQLGEVHTRHQREAAELWVNSWIDRVGGAIDGPVPHFQDFEHPYGGDVTVVTIIGTDIVLAEGPES